MSHSKVTIILFFAILLLCRVNCKTKFWFAKKCRGSISFAIYNSRDREKSEVRIAKDTRTGNCDCEPEVSIRKGIVTEVKSEFVCKFLQA